MEIPSRLGKLPLIFFGNTSRGRFRWKICGNFSVNFLLRTTIFCWLEVVTQTKLKAEGKQHQHSYFEKGNLFLVCTNSRRDFPIHRGAPGQAAPPTTAAIHNQEHFWHRICHTALFAPSQLLFQEEKHSRAKKIPAYRLKNRTEEPSDRRVKLSIHKATKGSPGSTSKWNRI